MSPLPEMIDAFRRTGRTAILPLGASRSSTRTSSPRTTTGPCLTVEEMSVSDVRINGGFFVFRREILDWIEPGDELVEETFAKLIPQGEVIAYPYEGFFGPMDTIKDRQRLEALYACGRRALAAASAATTSDEPASA